MWAVAGVLLGLVLLGSIVGFHLGPHSHAFASVIGVVTAIWLVAMAIGGQSAPILWALLSADLVVSAGIGTAAYKGIKTERILERSTSATSLAGAEGIAVSALDPEGLVRVRGEVWSATSLNGPVRAGGGIQIIEAEGVRLKVWGEDTPSLGPPQLLEDLDPRGEPTGAELPAPDDRRAGTS